MCGHEFELLLGNCLLPGRLGLVCYMWLFIPQGHLASWCHDWAQMMGLHLDKWVGSWCLLITVLACLSQRCSRHCGHKLRCCCR